MAKASGKAKAVRSARVDMVDFIKAWESSNSVPEVANKLNMKVPTVQARASKYRNLEDKNGNPTPIPLKHMPKGGGAKLDRSAALALIAELRGTTVEQITSKS